MEGSDSCYIWMVVYEWFLFFSLYFLQIFCNEHALLLK